MTATAAALHLSSRDYRRVAELVYRVAGIHLGDGKHTMVELRLRRRLEALDISSFSLYCDYLFGPDGESEIAPLLDVITTNKTDFYRESAHFDYLTGVALPSLQAGFVRPLAVWSAGCSSGQEPYSLAMVLSEYADQQAGYRFSVLATDISVRMLEKARMGVYDSDEAAPIPQAVRRKYLLRSRNAVKSLVRVAPEIRRLVEFRRLNLMDEDFRLAQPMDVIFCRNVVIYFDKQTQERLIGRFARNLRPGGYLFMGHSETLHGLDLPLAAVGPTIYRRKPVPL